MPKEKDPVLQMPKVNRPLSGSMRMGAASPPKVNRDPQQNHEDQLAQDAGVEATDETTTETDPDAKIRVEVLGDGHFLNGHPIPVNSVVEMTADQIDLHRERGYQLGPVADDYDGDIYDYSPEWQHPDNEKAA